MPLFTGLGVGGGYQFATVASTTGSPGTGTFTDSNGHLWSYYRYTGSGSMTISSEGYVDLLVVGGGGGGVSVSPFSGGGGGAVRWGIQWVTATTHTITIGGGGASNAGTGRAGDGGSTSFGSILTSGGGSGGYSYTNTSGNYNGYSYYSTSGGGSGGRFSGPVSGGGYGASQNVTLNYNNSSVSYGVGDTVASPPANTGNGSYNGTGATGIVIARVRLA